MLGRLRRHIEESSFEYITLFFMVGMLVFAGVLGGSIRDNVEAECRETIEEIDFKYLKSESGGFFSSNDECWALDKEGKPIQVW